MRYTHERSRQPQKRKRQPVYSERHYRKLDVPDLETEETRAKRVKKKKFNRGAIIVTAAVSVLVIFALLVPSFAKADYSEGWEVRVNGQVLGVVDDFKPINKALVDIQEEFKKTYNMEILDETELAFEKVKIGKNHICPPEVFVSILEDSVDVKVMAWVIAVNDRPAAAVQTKEEAEWVLEQILVPFQETKEGQERVSTGFVENVEIKNDAVEYRQLLEQEEALQLMTLGAGVEEQWHIVVTGESLSRISKQYGLRISDLRKANPVVASTDTIHPGDKLMVVAPKNRVNVKFTEVIDREEDMPAPEEIIKDDSMYVTEKKVKEAGKSGRREIKAEITYINGMEANVKVISETILVQPEPRVVYKGTKKVPAIVEMAAEGRMPFPLKGNYRISSKFGPRKPPVPGASSFHKGVDLAAPKGTPIYAPAAGTVKFAGSSGGYGFLVKINHGNGVETRYGHCSKLLVKKGQKVKKGQLIALVGSTGVSSGNHVHFEVRINGEAVDPQLH